MSVIEVPAGFDVAAPALVEQRALLLAAGQEWARYESVYFDAPERTLFHAQRRGIRPRDKIRIRHHLDRRLSFLEIKHKERSGRTTKARLDLPFGAAGLTGPELQFIESHVPVAAARLVPCVSVSFLRLTLLGRDAHERLTIDRRLRLSDGARVEELPHVVVAEVKQERHATAGAVAALLAQQARGASVSKYCLATVLLASVPANVFKPALRAIERLSG